ncbi:retrovirus-related Pol polyprotein from transposon 297 [Trichonephila clavipes]|nr:retrovirus-related Pol polyprotein from transposon 297 [Trichonephila clavipes]
MPDFVPKKLMPYRIPIAIQEEVNKINDLLQLGLIETIESEWVHPISSLKRMEAFISVLDLTKGYWQIPMKDEAKPLTAFLTHSGHYQWKVMPFGMKNAGSTFQKSMDNALLLNQKYCHSYIDDVAIYSTTWDEHLDHIAQESMSARSRTKGRNDLETESTYHKRCSQEFLGSDELLSRLYPELLTVIVLPLTNLTKKNIPKDIPWESSAEDSFVRLQEELVKMGSLHTPDLSRPFLLFTDASATDACLAQHNDHMEEMPIPFFSKKLTLSQMKWSTIQSEAFSVFEALRKFDKWILGHISRRGKCVTLFGGVRGTPRNSSACKQQQGRYTNYCCNPYGKAAPITPPLSPD